MPSSTPEFGTKLSAASAEALPEHAAPRRAPSFGWFARRWGARGLIGLTLLSVLTFAAAFGGPMSGDPFAMNIADRFQPPSVKHVMGTDEFGRDIASRVLHGARISLVAGAGVVLVGLSTGTTIGLVAAYRSGWTGTLLMGAIDLLLALPSVLLAIVIAALLAPQLSTAVIAVGIVNVPYYARLVWGVAQTVRTREYVEAARAAGGSDMRIVVRHILPGVIPPVMVQATLGVGNGILTVSALSFLGLGAHAPTPEWGVMLSQAQRFILTSPHMGVSPGLAIMLTVLGFNLTGDALRDMLDPVLSQTLGR